MIKILKKIFEVRHFFFLCSCKLSLKYALDLHVPIHVMKKCHKFGIVLLSFDGSLLFFWMHHLGMNATLFYFILIN